MREVLCHAADGQTCLFASLKLWSFCDVLSTQKDPFPKETHRLSGEKIGAQHGRVVV